MRIWFTLCLALSLLVAPLVDAAVLHAPADQQACQPHQPDAASTSDHSGHASHAAQTDADQHQHHGTPGKSRGFACDHGTCLAGIAMPTPVVALDAPTPLSAEPSSPVQRLVSQRPSPLERPPRLLA